MKSPRRRLNTNLIIQDFKIVHGEKYDYSLVEYVTMHIKVKIICPCHGIFEQTPTHHIRMSAGCRHCAFERQKIKQTDTTESFVAKSKLIHGENTYIYSLTKYGNNAHDKVIIQCKEHGPFSITPNSHLSKKVGCPVCNSGKTGWNRSSWLLVCENRVAKLYVIRCYNETESFYKIGITSKSVEERFNSYSSLPYKIEIVKLINSPDDPIYIFDLERCLHVLHNRFKYEPLISFDGDTECFTKILPILQ